MGILLFGIHHSQTYYSQNFNTPGLNGWVSTDLDGDGKKWGNLTNSLPSSFETGALASFSYNTAAEIPLNPDNLVTSPLVDLSTVTASNVYLLYDQAALDPNYPNEKYSVYITTSNTPAAIIAATPVYTETLIEGAPQVKSINLTPFIGQQVYISFRHYDCTDQYALLIDNVQVKTLADNDVALKKISLERYGTINTNYFIKARIKNNGAQSANTITMDWNDGTSHSSIVSLASPLILGQEKEISLPIPVNYPSVVEKNINISITAVNGSIDSTPTDNTLAAKFNIVSQNSLRKVVIEEATGTWCGNCPAGAFAMHNTTNNFPNDFIGIAVHGGSSTEPMKLAEYEAGLNLNYYPTVSVDRSLIGESIPNSLDFSSFINERKKIITPAALSAANSLSGRTFTLNASAIFRSDFTNSNFRFAVVMVEDGVTGTTPGYAQANYWAGGARGPMGGYESKPNPIPAADMVYDHVGRMLLGGYTGQVGSVPANITDGQTINYTFTTDIPTAYNINNMKAVLLLLDGTTGEIVNAAGPFTLNGTLATNEVKTNTSDIMLYPNPAKDYIKIQAKGKVDLKIYDINGRIVLEKSEVEPDTSISTQILVKGSYLVSVQEKGSEPKTKKLIIK